MKTVHNVFCIMQLNVYPVIEKSKDIIEYTKSQKALHDEYVVVHGAEIKTRVLSGG